jgi:hypothetical protein
MCVASDTHSASVTTAVYVNSDLELQENSGRRTVEYHEKLISVLDLTAAVNGEPTLSKCK